MALNLQRRNFTWSRLPSPPQGPTGPYSFVWTDDRVRDTFSRNIYQEIIRSSAFQRLADIRFLGAIDYFIRPTGRKLSQRRHTRIEHTLGVAHLALLYARMFELPAQEEMLVVCAALLHDIGHAPLSHSVEGAFKRHFELDHHIASARIITGHAPRNLGVEIPLILGEAELDPDQIVTLIEGKLNGPHDFLFSHPINIDTIEAISRSETYLKYSPTSPTPDLILKALLDDAARAYRLDDFWNLKDKIYRLLIQGPLGLYADTTALNYVENNIDAFETQDFFFSESQFRKKHPDLFTRLEDARTQLVQTGSIPQPDIGVAIAKRRFFIDESFEARSFKRYKQERATITIGLEGLRQAASCQLEQASA